MKNKVKELRIKIDGLAQLVKELKPQSQYRLNINAIPDGMRVDEFIYNFIQHGWELYDGQKGIDPIPQQFKEIEKSYDSLILAKAWLGKILGELGEETPYKNDGKRKTVENIEETADKAKAVAGLRESFTDENNKENIAKVVDTWELNGRNMTDYSNMNHIEKVDWLREEIKKLVTLVYNLIDDTYKDRTQLMITHIVFTYNHLSEARFWLGFELQRVKENEQNKSTNKESK